MMNTEAVSKAISMYLDNYFLTSEPFRKLTEQYMQFWLNNFHMPSREEVSQLAQQMNYIESRIDDINAKSDEIGQTLHNRFSTTGSTQSELNGEHVPPLSYTQYAHKTHVDALHARIDEIGHILQEHLPQVTAHAQNQAARMQALETHIQALDTKLDRMLQRLSPQSVSAGEADSFQSSDLEAHMNSLDRKAEQLLALIDSLKDIPGPEA